LKQLLAAASCLAFRCCKSSTNPKPREEKKMAIDRKGLTVLMGQANALANKNRLTTQEEKRYGLLLSQISLLKTGEVTLADLDQDMLDDMQREHGLPSTKIAPTKLTGLRAKGQAFLTAMETRASEAEGNLVAQIGTYTGSLSQFVPTEFIQEVYAAMAAHDAFLDEDAVSMLDSTNGRVTTIPTYGDIENVATAVAEAADQGTAPAAPVISAPGHAVSAVYKYPSKLHGVSFEAFQDAEAMGSFLNVFKKVAADRISRGAARDLAVGDGSNKPLGIIPALLAAGVTPVTAVGSAVNTGGTEDSTNSLGSKDIAKLYHSVNPAYRNNPKTAFFMNDSTLLYLAQLTNKVGAPLVEWDGPDAWIYGKPVRISPSMDNIGPSNHPVIFGDGSYWLSRNVVDQSYVQIYKEVPGLVENGLLALQMVCRWGGTLLYTDSGSPAPFGVLQNHS
jgi:HK97 family phage major capsid protein